MLLNTIKDIKNLQNKTVVVRADLNVPVIDGIITDSERIARFVPTAKYLSDNGAKVVIITHFGRPKGRKNPEFSTRILLDTLSKFIEKSVLFVDDVIGDNVKKQISAMNSGDICILENVRFYDGEEKNDPDFAKQLSELGDVFVNDAFSTSHRAHASTEGISKYLPSYAGFLMEEEVNALSNALEAPVHPAIAVVGGSKVSTKIDVLKNITKKVDAIVIGGAMANTFLLAKGYNIGASMVESDMLDVANSIINEAEKSNCEIVLPIDVCVANELKENISNHVVDIDNVSGDEKIFDVGIKTSEFLKEKFSDVKTVLWNGPLGVFEIPPFDRGTNDFANFIADLTALNSVISVAGGGDTVSALKHADVYDKFSYISTAGGAFLEWLEGKELPAIVPLKK